jgi:hypothetical protein
MDLNDESILWLRLYGYLLEKNILLNDRPAFELNEKFIETKVDALYETGGCGVMGQPDSFHTLPVQLLFSFSAALSAR